MLRAEDSVWSFFGQTNQRNRTTNTADSPPKFSRRAPQALDRKHLLREEGLPGQQLLVQAHLLRGAHLHLLVLHLNVTERLTQNDTRVHPALGEEIVCQSCRQKKYLFLQKRFLVEENEMPQPWFIVAVSGRQNGR